MKKTILLAILLLPFISTKIHAQYSLNSSGSSALITCDSVQQSLTINKNTAFLATDQIVVKLDLNDSINLILPVLGNDGTMTVSNDTLRISGVDSVTHFTITYWVQANCNFIIQQSGILTYNQNISVDINGTLLTANKPFTITPAILVFRGGLNLNVSNARIGQVIERTFVYKNTSSQAPFTGVFQFQDTLFTSSFDAGLRFDTVFVASSNGTEISHLITDTSATLTLHVNHLVQTGDSLVIKERITLVDCPTSSFDNAQTLVTAYYGCTATDICKKVAVPNEIGNIIFARIDPNLKPTVGVKTRYEIGDCFTDDLRKSFKFTNIGTDTASNTILYINQYQIASLFNFSSVDPSSIGVTFFNGSTYQNLPFTLTVPPYHGSLQRIYELDLNRKLSPGDSVILSFDINQACIDPLLYDSIAKTYSKLNYYQVEASAKFEHACKPDSMGAYFWYEHTDHPYSLSQTFNNLNAILGDSATAWYEIENSTPLELNSDVYGTLTVPVKLDSTEIEVRLIIQEGLGLTSSSDFYLDLPLGATSVHFNPYSVNIIPGPSGVGSGDTVIARFRFSDLNSSYNLSDPYNDGYYAFVEKLMPDFTKLFNKFKVKFQLQAYCRFAPPNGRVNIKQQFLLILNPSCDACKLPLESISSFTNVNCPGCVLPGWNLTSFDLKRKNYGFADNNNNYLPDSYPQVAADPLKIDLKRAMIGDTLRADMSGFISEGQDFDSLGNRVGYTFSSIGFDYDEGQLLFTGPGMKNLQFIGATGTFHHLDSTYNITIPANAGVYTLPGRDNFFISMDAAHMRSFGVTGFDKYWDGDAFTINPEFRIIKNLTDNDGSNPYFGIQTVNCFYVMGGEPFTIPLQYPEANDANDNHELDALTGAQRGAYKYWCTAYESRYIGVGYDMARYGASAEDLTFYWNYMSYYENRPSICNEAIHYNHSFLTGKRDLSDYDPNMESSFSFPFEIREVAKLDTLTFNFPEEYEVDKILFANYNPYYDSVKNKTTWDGYVMATNNLPHGFYHYEYDLSNSSVTSTSIEIYPAANMDQITAYPYNNYGDSSYLWLNGETKLYGVSCLLKPKNCQSIAKYVPYTDRTIVADYSNIPLDLTDGDSSLTIGVGAAVYPNPPQVRFTNAKPVFSFQPLQNYQFNEDGNVFWDVSFNTNDLGNADDNRLVRPVENAFLSFFSPSGKFENYDIPTFDTYLGASVNNTYNGYFHDGYNYNVNKFDSVYTDINKPDQTIYGVGYMGTTGDPNTIMSKKLRLLANFDCSQLPPGAKDSIGIIMGWNCFDYPSSIEEACYVDTTYLVVEVPDISMNVTETLPTTVSSCDVAHFSFLMDVAGIGELNNLSISIENKGEGSYQYLNNSAHLQVLSSNTVYNPIVTDSSWVWNLDELSNQLSENDFTFSFDVLTGCNVAQDVLDINIHGENFCGKVIVDKNYSWKPTIVTGLPQVSSLNVQVSNSLSGNLSTFTYTVQNTGTSATGPLNTILLDLPAGFVYSGSDPAIENLGGELLVHIAAGIAPNTAQTIALVIKNTNTICATYHLNSYVKLSEYFFCRQDTCTYQTTSDTLVSTVAPESVPACAISGIAPDCNNLTQVYSAPVSTENLTYSWNLTSANNATVSGAANTSSLVVVSGSCNAAYTLNLSVVNSSTGCHSECSETFSFADLTAPVFTSTGSNLNLTHCTDLVEFTAPTATDNCSAVSIVQLSDAMVSNSDGSKTYTRTWKAIDACGNESETVSQSITDHCFDPCPEAGFSVSNVCAGSTIHPTPVQTQGIHQWIYSDMNQTSTAVNPSFTATHAGTYSLTHIVSSDCGASDTVVHQVTINAVSCAIIGTAPDCSHLTKVYSVPASTDNLTYAWTLASATNAVLSGSGPSVSVVSGSCSAAYTLNLSVVNPATGCHSECSETFSFADITAPVYLSVPSNLLLGSCNDVPQFTAPVATDNCSAVSIIQLSDGVLSNSNGSKTYTRTWKAIDNCGNEAPVVSQSITVPACATSGNVYCTLTQGFYGNAKGVACATGERGDVLVQRLLSAPYGNLVVGKPGKMLTITSADAACLIKRLPAGGTASALPAGNHVFGANCANAIPVSNQGKFSNVLLGQTITLGLNLRMNAPLGALALSPQITTLTGNPGKDHLCGTADDVPVVGSEIQKNIPASVITALNSIYSSHTIANLFDLANRALGGQATGGASLSDINQAVSAINEGFDGCRFLKTTNAYIISSDFGVEARDRFKTDIYPNPFSENFSIDYQYEATSRIELIVTDLFGKVVYRTDLDPKRSTHDVNLAHVADGMYLVNVILDGEPQETNRIVKTK